MHSPIDEDDYKRAMEAIERLKARRAEARKQDIERRYGKKPTRKDQYDIIDLERMYARPVRGEAYWPGG